MPQTPSVGRIVHYVSFGTPGGEYTSQCRAAIITEVPATPSTADTQREDWDTLPNGLVGLAVLNPTGMFFNEAENDENDKRGGTWHWPEQV